MSPPEVWGPPIWTLFHTLAENINDNAYHYIINSLFLMIQRICKFLPCPECSRDASNFLAKIKLNDYKNKLEFKNMLYLFHNYVNAKKRKRLFNYAHINKYAKLNITFVVNDFISKYNTKGNMKLLTESFQRSFVIKDFIVWFKANYIVFIQPVIQSQILSKTSIKETSIIEKMPVIEEINDEEKNNNIISSDEQINYKINDNNEFSFGEEIKTEEIIIQEY